MATDQCHFYGSNGRRNLLDICIGKSNKENKLSLKRIKIVVEVKKDSPLKNHKLKGFDKIKNINKAKKITLLKSYGEDSITKWDKKHWSVFYYNIYLIKII